MPDKPEQHMRQNSFLVVVFFLCFVSFPGVLCTDMCLRLQLCKLYLDRGQALVLAGWFSHKTFTTHTHAHTRREPRLHSLLFLMQLEAWALLSVRLAGWTWALNWFAFGWSLGGQRLQHYQCHSVCSAPVHKSAHMRLIGRPACVGGSPAEASILM